ncbi:putative 2-aminoethylphosphonate ABC transporter ATP-binding protein [Noviherbaspirillum cavernae]|uniref:Putative 2-aminoethylphosphonate ABC transporter ATP-binding protein n=1 Tax=Noviherbaspirillum cavernae TaxID=2320862 RepID=A0A418WVU9_9BURK|nr:putative 2-aminoethylphosphonate ABC transporter ATP-binding protein [Noviherbaspirillum cavernae]RJF96651.1 putative 2-aminoethylphosphonate ABC transporter ATP-binding protein [Noviherbaspirillum cavernae]
MKSFDLPLNNQETGAHDGSDAWLRIANVSKAFGASHVLSDVSLQVRKGEFLCLLGPSGCGKTTLLRILAGLEQQDAGTIAMAGRRIEALPPARRDYGIVFQSYALFPNMTVADNVAYALRSPREERMRRVGELLDLVGLTGKEGRYPAQLSGGQQQRVALARALATSPGLLLLDEPLSALDAKVREHLRQELRSLQRTLGITTIMVTHDQDEALAMADTIAVMANGRIEQIGTPEQIYRTPATRFVADFIGRANWLPVQVYGNGVAILGDLSFDVQLPAGRATTAFCRPESVCVEKNWRSGENMTLAVVERVDFHGGVRRGVLSLCVNRAIRVFADASPNEAGYDSLVVGKRVPISFPAHQMCFFLDAAA